MRRFSLAVFAAAIAFCLAACTPPASEVQAPQDAIIIEEGDAAQGLLYAQAHCAACHSVRAGETQSPDPKAAAFQTVANRPGMTYLALDIWLHTPHPTMPNLIVERERIGDLAAYISTLRTSAPQGEEH